MAHLVPTAEEAALLRPAVSGLFESRLLWLRVVLGQLGAAGGLTVLMELIVLGGLLLRVKLALLGGLLFRGRLLFRERLLPGGRPLRLM